MRKAIVIAVVVFLIALAMQAVLHRRFPDRSIEWVPLAFIALALRASTRLLGRRQRGREAEKKITAIRLKA
jgi:hypothetical protein